MRIYLIILAVLIGENLYSQEFKFNLFFQDSKGNKDTITLGYDINATDSIDSKLGETNIYKQQIDSIFISQRFDLKNTTKFSMSLSRKNDKAGYKLILIRLSEY